MTVDSSTKLRVYFPLWGVINGLSRLEAAEVSPNVLFLALPLRVWHADGCRAAEPAAWQDDVVRGSGEASDAGAAVTGKQPLVLFEVRRIVA